LVGEQRSGKTSFAWRFSENKFEETLPQEIIQQKNFNKTVAADEETSVTDLQEIDPSEINENTKEEVSDYIFFYCNQ
jgi:GTPase SAR1 family protein